MTTSLRSCSLLFILGVAGLGLSPGCATPECPSGLAVEGSACVVVDPLQPFELLSTDPVDEATDVPVADASVVATFNSTLDPESVNTSTFSVANQLGTIEGTAARSEGGREAVFTPASRLPLFVPHDATLTTGIMDEFGRPLPQAAAWSFFTRDGVWSAPDTLDEIACDGLTEIQVELDDRGNGTAIWLEFQSDGSGCSLWTSRYVPDQGWGAATQLDESEDGVSAPDLAVAPDGTGQAVWIEDQLIGGSSFSRVFAAALSEDGQWSAPAPVVSLGQGVSFSAPAVGAANGGAAVAAWLESDMSELAVFASPFSSGAGTWGQRFRLNDQPASVAVEPKVEMDGDSNAIALFGETVGEGVRTDVWSRVFNGDTGLWGDAVLVEFEMSGSARNAVLAVAQDGRAIAAWEQEQVISMQETEQRVWANAFLNGVWATAGPLDEAGGFSRDPSVDIIDGGVGMVIWADFPDMGAASVLVSQFVDPAGFGAPAVVETGSISPSRPTVRLDPYGNAIAAGIRAVDNPDIFSVWRNRFAPSTGWGAEAEMVTDFGREAALAVDPLGTALLLWSEPIDMGLADLGWSRFD